MLELSRVGGSGSILPRKILGEGGNLNVWGRSWSV